MMEIKSFSETESSEEPQLSPLGGEQTIPQPHSEPLPLSFAPSVVAHPRATTVDADDAIHGEAEEGVWNLFGRLAVTRRTEAAVKAVASLVVLLLLILGSAITRYQSLHQTTNTPASVQATTMFAGFAWSLLIAPMVVLTLWLGANLGMLVLQEWHAAKDSAEDDREAESYPDAEPDEPKQKTLKGSESRPM